MSIKQVKTEWTYATHQGLQARMLTISDYVTCTDDTTVRESEADKLGIGSEQI